MAITRDYANAVFINANRGPRSRDNLIFVQTYAFEIFQTGNSVYLDSPSDISIPME